MTVEEIMEYRRATPFKPFVLQLKDGREFVISEPHEIGRDEKYTFIHFAADEDSGEMAMIEQVAGVKLLRVTRGRSNRKGRSR